MDLEDDYSKARMRSFSDDLVFSSLEVYFTPGCTDRESLRADHIEEVETLDELVFTYSLKVIILGITSDYDMTVWQLRSNSINTGLGLSDQLDSKDDHSKVSMSSIPDLLVTEGLLYTRVYEEAKSENRIC